MDGIAVGGGAFIHGVHVDGDEQVGIGLVGCDGAVLQFHKGIVLPRHDHFHIRESGLDLLSQAQAHVQDDVLFVGFLVPAHATRVLAAVSRVYDHGPEFYSSTFPAVLCGHGDCKECCCYKR